MGDTNLFILIQCLALFFVGCAILVYVNYRRDKDNIPSLRKIEHKIDFYSLDLIKVKNRITSLEDRQHNIDDLRNSIKELKVLIQRRRNV